jgi:hypothetical protein
VTTPIDRRDTVEAGVILRRPVGSHGPFKEHAGLPKHLSGDKSDHKRAKARTKQKKQVSRPPDDKAAKRAALAFEREQRQRERERQKEEAASAKERKRQQRVTAKAQAAMEKAEQNHLKRASTIETDRARSTSGPGRRTLAGRSKGRSCRLLCTGLGARRHWPVQPPISKKAMQGFGMFGAEIRRRLI